MLAAQVGPDDLPTLHLHAALSCLQMNAPRDAAEFLGDPPNAAAPLSVQVADAMVRLQVEVALKTSDPSTDISAETTDRALSLFGEAQAQEHDWSLAGALTGALFLSGRSQAALLLATLFVRQIDTVRQTLPQRSSDARERRKAILSILELLQPALVWGNYLDAAEKISGLKALLTHGGAPAEGEYNDWAPDERIAKQAGVARSIVANGRDNGDTGAFRAFVESFERDVREPAPLQQTARESGLSISFITSGGQLVRFVQEGSHTSARPVEAPAEMLGRLVKSLQNAIADDKQASEQRSVLGSVLFAGLDDQIKRANHMAIAPFGPVARVPFAALQVGETLLGDHRDILIKSHSRVSLAGEIAAKGANRDVVVLFSSGWDPSRLRHVEPEASNIASIHGVPETHIARLSETSQLLRAFGGHPQILHIAGRFRMIEGFIGASFIEGENAARISLSPLVEEMPDLRGLRLVYLSGCDSAGSCGNESLAAQLIASGADRVIASIWRVPDEASSQLATQVHMALLEGLPPEQALASASTMLRRNPKFANPINWAGFQCYGC